MKKSSRSFESLSLSLFITFLGRNDAYGSFLRNCSKNPSYPDISVLKNLTPDSYVYGAFLWEKTPEGFDYWKLINDKWTLVLTLFNL